MTMFERLVIRALLILIRTQYTPGTTNETSAADYLRIKNEQWAEDYKTIKAWEADADALLSPAEREGP